MKMLFIFKYKIKKYWDSLKNFIKNFWTDKNILWSHYDWDYSYLLELEKFKLQLMIDNFTNYPHVEHKNHIKWMSISIKLIDIILEKDMCINYDFNNENITINKYINIRNAERFNCYSQTHNVNEQLTLFGKEMLRERKALYLYNAIRYNYLYEWWD